jgi:xanthine/CO dehydrogenase XdhC/CoxF family maturation factor
VIRRYDTHPDDDGSPAYGLGCNGIIDILLERVAPDDAPALRLMKSVRETRQPAAIAHLLQPNQREIEDHLVARELEAAKAAALALGASCHVSLPQEEGPVEAFIEVLAPPVRLLLFGAGDDAVPLTELAHYLGWSVFVLDGRAHYARPERFLLADAVRVCRAEDPQVQVDPWTVAVLMSHSYSQDLSALRALAGEPLRYLGILGPRKRTLQLIADAGLDETVLPNPLHSPVGLDIGADGPQQVALSIIAEIQATLNGRRGGPLKERAGSIHSRSENEPEPFTVHSIVCA